jgi:DNA-binding protein HU-beta
MGEDMNKTELINALSEETNFSKKDVAKVLASFTRIVERTLKKGGKVSLTGFGTYWISRRPARTGINPATKQRIQLPAISVPRFKPGKHLKEQVRAL